MSFSPCRGINAVNIYMFCISIGWKGVEMLKKGVKETLEKAVALYDAGKRRYFGMIRKVRPSPEKESELYRAAHP